MRAALEFVGLSHLSRSRSRTEGWTCSTRKRWIVVFFCCFLFSWGSGRAETEPQIILICVK